MSSSDAIDASISAVAALLAAGLSAFVLLRVNRLQRGVSLVVADKTREAQLVIGALDHLIGGSQERTAGLAALRVLSETTDDLRWATYKPAITDLLSVQAQYVLTGGRNRWEAHEIANVRTIASWFLQGNGWTGDAAEVSRVRTAAERYISDWEAERREDGHKYDDGGRANAPAVKKLIRDMREWFGIGLDNEP